MTNREWLSTLTDEEFAKLYHLQDCWCVYNDIGLLCFENRPKKKTCLDGIIAWLKDEHKEEENAGR